ncbi:MAG: UPF0149 family protein [Methylococcales bacterium]
MTNYSIADALLQPLSQDEINELDDFLMSEHNSDDTMPIDTLDGFLTAIIIGPTTLEFNQWYPHIWGASGDETPNFKSKEDARHILDLIIRLMNNIVANLDDEDSPVSPLFTTSTFPDDAQGYLDGEMWAYGFHCGIELCRKDWQPFFDDPDSAEVMRPIRLLLGDDVGVDEKELTSTPAQREELTMDIPESVAWIYEFWSPYRDAMFERRFASTFRVGDKAGRNDSCPCGSGLMFNKCCGAAIVLH